MEARNRIEKVGDLEVHSFIRAEIIASYLDEGPRVEVPAKLFDGTKQLLENIPDDAVGTHVRKHGILAIQRRWVENTLPDFELLDAVATAYGRLSNLVADAHEQAGLPHPVTTNTSSKETFAAGFREGRLPCMIAHAETRTLHISLADGARMTIEAREEPFDIGKAKEAAAKFGVKPDAIFPLSASNAEDALNSLFDTARTVFLKDGYHQTIAFFLKEARPIHMEALHPEDQAQKYLMMRQVANEVARRGADAVILLAEAWTAKFDRTDPYKRAADAPDRQEVLCATLAQSAGDAVQLSALIKRKRAKITLAGTVRVRSPAVWSFAPVYRVWGRPLPDEWNYAIRGEGPP